MRSTLPTAAATALLLCALPAAASASTTVSKVDGVISAVSTTPGDNSRLVLDASSGTRLSARDTQGGTVIAGAGCTAQSGGVICTTADATKITAQAGPGNDHVLVYGTLPLEADGEAGDDQLSGGDGDDVLVGGPGADVLSGRKGADVLRAQDGGADNALDCGDDDDDLEDDPSDPAPYGCEVVAPTIDGTPTLSGEWRVGATVSADGVAFAATPATGFTVTMRWERCANGTCVTAKQLADDDTSYTIVAADAGHTLRFVAEASNRAGTGVFTSAASPVVTEPTPVPTTPVTPSVPTTETPTVDVPVLPAVPPTVAAPTVVVPPAGVVATPAPPALGPVGMSLGRAVAPLAQLRLRAVRDRAATAVPVVLPAAGKLTVRLTIHAAVARTLGLNVKGNGRVLLSRGTATGAAGAAVPVELRSTMRGRRALRKTRTMKVRLAASLQTAGGRMTARRSLTLHR